MRFEDIERRAARAQKGRGRRGHSTLGTLVRSPGRQREKTNRPKSLPLARPPSALLPPCGKAQSKEAGSAPTAAEDYREVPAKEGIRQGVEERSYEEGNALIIERTVRVENEVNVYRKTVAKHGVYYFKNNRSITQDIWVLETFEIAD